MLKGLKNGLGERELRKMENVTSVLTFEVESKWLIEGEKRLNAFSFSPDAASSLLLIDKLRTKGIKIDDVDCIVKDIFYPSRFKRLYVRKGAIFLSSKDIFDFLPEGKRIRNVSKEYLIKPGWILVTRSGSVGRVLIANRFTANAAISEHVIRIIPNESTPTGYLFTYLVSKIGQPLLIKNIFGGVVDEIEPHHVAKVPISRIPELEKEINQRIREAHRLREEAQELLLEAEEMLYSELGLPEIDEDHVKYFGGENGRIVKNFEIKASELNLRLDASYHSLVVQMVKANLSSCKMPLQNLSSLAKDIFIPPRFKRPYVKNESAGIPFLSGSHLIEVRPLDVKYLWKNFKEIDLYKVYTNWILISARGTVGRPCLVTVLTNGFTVSDNIIRCIPDESKISSSYLYAFLLTSYALYQINAQKAGGVQDLLQPIHLKDIYVPVPSSDIQRKIGDLVLQAYDKRDKSNQIEDEAIKLLERKLEEIAEGNQD